MLLKQITANDRETCVKKTNEFIKKLPFGAWYSTTMNPVIQEVHTSEKVVTDGNTVTTEKVSKNVMDFTSITYFISKAEMDTAIPRLEPASHSVAKRQSYTG